MKKHRIKGPKKLELSKETLRNMTKTSVVGGYYKTFTCTVCGCQETEYTCGCGGSFDQDP